LIVILVIATIAVITAFISLIKERNVNIASIIIPYMTVVITTILAFVMSNYINATTNDKLNSIVE
jgi:cytochrome c oxidase subunit IV